MKLQEKKHTLRGMNDCDCFRSGQECDLELSLSPADEEHPAKIVIINPVSRLWTDCNKQEFALR